MSLLAPSANHRFTAPSHMSLGTWSESAPGSTYRERNSHFRHPLGIVLIEQWFTGAGGERTMMAAIHDGTEFRRDWDRHHPNRTLSRLAREFLEDIQ